MVRSRQLMQNCVLISPSFKKVTSHSNIWHHEIGHILVFTTKTFFFLLCRRKIAEAWIYFYLFSISVFLLILDCSLYPESWKVNNVWTCSFLFYEHPMHRFLISGCCLFPLASSLSSFVSMQILHLMDMQNTFSQGIGDTLRVRFARLSCKTPYFFFF